MSSGVRKSLQQDIRSWSDDRSPTVRKRKYELQRRIANPSRRWQRIAAIMCGGEYRTTSAWIPSALARLPQLSELGPDIHGCWPLLCLRHE
ncbi:hypothetical protein KC338_g127 [Hortaea werneckii]|nr:hypothetical protein KC338_g127 [Hortaea werneckii]